MAPKYVYDRATARHAINRLGSYVRLDRDEVPRGTIPENVAKGFCIGHNMNYRDSFIAAAALFKAYEMKLNRTPRRSRTPKVQSGPARELIGREVVVRCVESGQETRLSEEYFIENASDYPEHKYKVRHVDIFRVPKTAFSQGLLF